MNTGIRGEIAARYRNSLGVTVNDHQATCCAKPREHSARVTAATERRIDVAAIRTNSEGFDRLSEKDRGVEGSFHVAALRLDGKVAEIGRHVRRQRGVLGEPSIATLVPAGLVPKFEAVALTDEHNIALQGSKLA